jgi:hypothetical protein
MSSERKNIRKRRRGNIVGGGRVDRKGIDEDGERTQRWEEEKRRQERIVIRRESLFLVLWF